MILTDKKALSLNEEFALDLRSYPEDERDGRSDLEIVKDEVEYLIECYKDDGYALHDELTAAKKLLKRTNDGKTIPISLETFRPLAGFTPADIEAARAVTAAFERCVQAYKKLLKEVNKCSKTD